MHVLARNSSRSVAMYLNTNMHVSLVLQSTTSSQWENWGVDMCL